MAVLLIFLHFFFANNELTDDETIIMDKLMNQAKCWNDANIECFMEDYWKNEDLMYIGKNGVTYGWQKTLDNYKKKYPTKNEMGLLKFDVVKLERLNDGYYFMVGKWHLTRELGNTEGHFSLVWKKIENEWVIIADHSS